MPANAPEHFQNLTVRRGPTPRTAYILTVSGVLGVVTFALVYLTTLSLITG